MLERRCDNARQRSPEDITQFQTRILTTGIRLQQEGFDWWHAIQMIDAMKERRLIRDWQRSVVHVNLAILQRDGLIHARWGLPEEPEEVRRYFQVTEDGERARSRIAITSDARNLAPDLIPQTIS